MRSQFEPLKRILEARETRLKALCEQDLHPTLTDVAASIQDAYGNSGDSEAADWATDLYDITLARSMDAHHRDELKAVRQALLRIERGTYGQCIRCTHRIPVGRLNAVPESPYCLSCAMEVEAEG